MRFVMAYSGGKDSALALYRMIQQGHEPVAIITTVNEDQGRSWIHGIRKEVLEKTAISLGLPLIICGCKVEAYESALENSLKEAKALGAEACVFGDIDIEDHKTWNEQRCASVGLDCILPLWKEPRESLTRETLEVGFKAMIKLIQKDQLTPDFLGETLSPEIIDRIKQLGCDVCGENGEYHTFVYDGPIFSTPIPIKIRETVDLGNHMGIEILYDEN